MIIYCLFFTVVFFTNYFKWKVAIESKFTYYQKLEIKKFLNKLDSVKI